MNAPSETGLATPHDTRYPGTDMTMSFNEALDGSFTGVLRWPQLDQLWDIVQRTGTSWYLYQIGEEPPTAPLAKADLRQALASLDQLLRTEHSYDYCGIVYADDPAAPRLVKVYDPHHLGSSCGCTGQRIPPRWILSQMPPERIDDPAPVPNSRRRWWQRLWQE